MATDDFCVSYQYSDHYSAALRCENSRSNTIHSKLPVVPYTVCGLRRLQQPDGISNTFRLAEKAPLGVVWDSGLALTTYLLQNFSLSSLRILELGAGTGISSICCGIGGALTVATDMVQLVLHLNY